jgi:ABC-type transport system substrate-binding protein
MGHGMRRLILVFFVSATLSPIATAQTRLTPLRLADLAREAKGADPASATLLREVAELGVATDPQSIEQTVLDRLGAFLVADSPRERWWTAEKILRATLRHHDDRRAADGKTPLTVQLEAKLKQARIQLLTRTDNADAEATAWADVWLPLYPGDGDFGDAVRTLWVRQAETHLQKNEPALAATWLARLDRAFNPNPATQALRKTLQTTAATRFAELQKAGDDADTLRKLQEMNAYSPRLPGLHDEIARRQKTYQTLRVAVPSLPLRLSPATACTDVELQCLDLLFERLVRRHDDPALGRRLLPQLALRLPGDDGSQRAFTLRPDAFWSDGEPLTPADVRHTAQLSAQETRWRDLLETPRFEGPHTLSFALLQPMASPLSAFDFPVLPRTYHGKPLKTADDAEFAKAPVGSGPFAFAEVSKDAKIPFVRLRANPFHVRDGATGVSPIREVHLGKWEDGQPLPHLVWDVPADQVAAWKQRGHAVKTLPSSSVQMLAFNPRKPALANVALRRAFAHAVNREAILAEAFHHDAKEPRGANGPFPRGSWAAAPAPRVPASLDQPEQARVFARKAKQEVGPVEFSLAYLESDPAAAKACALIVQQIQKVAAETEWKVVGKLQPIPAAQWRAVVKQRSYDLAYVSAESLDDPLPLWLFIDPLGEGSLAPNDAKLNGMLRSALAQRHFASLKETMQQLHVHFHETMPFVPLWQRNVPVAIHPSLQTPALDADHLFANFAEWKWKGGS